MTTATIEQAESAHRSGDLEAAKAIYTQLLETNGDNVDALYGLATIALQQTATKDALPLFQRAAALQPEAADIHLNHAVCLFETGHLQDAIAAANRAAALAWNDEFFLVAIGNLLIKLGEPASISNLFRGIAKPSADARILLAKSHGLLGEWDRAVALLHDLHREQSDNAAIANELALAAGKLRDYPLAIASFEHYLSLVTPTAQDHLRFADLLLIARDIGYSERELALAASLATESSEFHVLKARLARLSGNTDEAISATSAALDLDAHNGQAWGIHMEISDSAALPTLIARMKSLLREEIANPYFRSLMSYALANAYLRSGDSGAAFVELETANNLQQEHFRERGLAYDFARKEEEAEGIIRHFSKLTTSAPINAEQPIPIFIVGMPRSGTTLMEKLLSQLDEVTATGENETMGFLGTQYQLDANKHLVPLPENMQPHDWQSLAEKYLARNHLRNRYITDKMPHNFNHVGMILSMFPKARVLQMRRDPRDVCLSIYTRSFPDGHPYACSFESLAHAYMLCQRIMDHWAQLEPTRVMDIKYADLVSNTRELGENIFRFCGLQWQDRCLEFHRDVTPSFTFSEMQVRRAISTDRVNRWQAYDDHLGDMYAALARWNCL